MSRNANNFPGAFRNRQYGDDDYDSIRDYRYPLFARSASGHLPADYYVARRQYPSDLHEDLMPLGLTRAPIRPWARVLVLGSGLPGGIPFRPRESLPQPALPTYMNQQAMHVPTYEDNSRLSQEEQKNVLRKLRKEIYIPGPRRLARTLSLYYRDPYSSGTSTTTYNNEDGKNCAICLEDFQPREEVTLTPCNHMFHHECIVPWVKDHGKCPVCRYAMSESVRANRGAPPAPNPATNHILPEELLSIIQAMDAAFPWG